MAGHIIDLNDDTYEELQWLREQIRVLAQGMKVTDEMAIREAIALAKDLFKDDSFMDGYTQDMMMHLKDFQEGNK